ncbi:ricin-agglutinin family protein [Ricinus communis]|uniref:Ribosome-inactivating protein n=1 Tax=Ricinus communis TaxID=3988 RepID=B9SSU3_RICCO|nr:ricin-agglutinin family protein [Ricinus communis]|eukprot:XP_002529062.1 ricin-like [Ricinus communis]
MKGNTLAWLLYVVAIWLWFGSTSLAGPVAYTSLQDYPTVRFTTGYATAGSYRLFITSLRNRLATGQDVRHGIPVLRDRVGLPIVQRFVLVELSNWLQEPVILALDVTTANVVGFRAGKNAYFFHPDNPDDAQAITHLFKDTTQRQTFNFSGNYSALENQAHEERDKIDLGIQPLEEAISSIYLYSLGQAPLRALASDLIVCIQMVSEAARFGYIEERIGQSITSSTPFRPRGRILSYERSWEELSSAIQQSLQQVFKRVRLQDESYRVFYVDNVRDVLIYTSLALMKFRCQSPRQSSSGFSLVIKPVVPNFADGLVCEEPEPTVRISGRDGLCVDVRFGSYANGNAIQLWPCKSNSDVNQLWTLKRDGTIRSNGKCLTSNGHAPGDRMMIYDCPSAVTNATSWQIWENGTIMSKSGLVLAAPGGSFTTLTVENNTYAASQSWLPSNNTEPIVTSILGLRYYCLEANGNDVWLDKCASNKTEQKWALYRDGSVRPEHNRDSCLTNDPKKGIIVEIQSCSPASSGQLWAFRNDGTIWNLHQQKVLDVAYADPDIKRIVIWKYKGQANQKWALL